MEACPLNKLLKIFNLDRLLLLMFYPIEQSIQKHIVLLLICELVLVCCLKRLHQLTELVLGQSLFINRQRFHDIYQRVEKSLLGLFVVLR